jgi:hypothetical protein
MTGDSMTGDVMTGDVLLRADGGTATVRAVSFPGLLAPGPKFLALYLLAVPVAVVAFASVGPARYLSAIVAATWLALAPVALYAKWAAILLPVAGGAFLLLSAALLPFNSFAFVVDLWAALAMLISSAPRHRMAR